MSEASISENETPIVKHRSLEKAFEATYKIPVPESPALSPNEINLPAESIGGFFEGVFAQDSHDRDIPRERSQFVGVLSRDGHLNNSEVFVGNEAYVGLGDALHQFKGYFYPITKNQPDVLLKWHSHRSRSVHEDKNGDKWWEHGEYLSNGDIGQFLSKTTKSIIYLLGAPEGIRAIIKTKQILKPRYQLSAFKEGADLLDKIYEVYTNRDKVPDETALSKFLEERGYVLYGWRKPNPEDTLKSAYYRGDFLKNIHLNRIGDPVWLRRIMSEQK